MNMKNGGKILE